MAAPRGLGPKGRQAVQNAQQELTAAPVSDTSDVIVNPAALDVAQTLPERDTMPSAWWYPTQSSEPGVAGHSTRVAAAGYDSTSARLYVLFHKPFPGGTPWTYEGVPPSVWRNMRRTKSAGKYVNRVLNRYDYHRGEWLPDE